MKNTTTQEQVITALKSRLAQDERWAVRGLLRINQEQLADEQLQDETNHHNNVGFTKTDAFILSRFAKAYQQYRRLSPKQMAIVTRKMPTYARQLVRLTGTDKIRQSLQPAQPELA